MHVYLICLSVCLCCRPPTTASGSSEERRPGPAAGGPAAAAAGGAGAEGTAGDASNDVQLGHGFGALFFSRLRRGEQKDCGSVIFFVWDLQTQL